MPRNEQRSRHRRRAAGGRLDAVLLCVVVAICAAVVAGFAWTRPTTLRAALTYTQMGKLSYGGVTSPDSIYGSAGLSTGEPVYLNTLSTLSVTYAYRFEATAPSSLAGTEQLVAKMDNGEGITRTIPLQSLTAFTGRRFVTTANLQLAALEAVATTFSQAAGQFSDDGTYAVTISPAVNVHGRLGTVPLRAHFDPVATFTLGSGVLSPASSASGTAGAASTSSTSQALAQRFSSTASGSVKLPSGRPAILFLGLSVVGGRIVSLTVLLAALLIGMLLAMPLLRDLTSDDERARIGMRFGTSLVEVDAIPESPMLVVVELSSFEGLSQVARRLECPLLRLRSDRGDSYMVVDNGTLYRYRDLLTRSRHGPRALVAGSVDPPPVATNGDAAASQARIP
jgi:hypothetical protein